MQLIKRIIAIVMIIILSSLFGYKLEAQKSYYKHFNGKSVYKPILPNAPINDKKDIFSTLDLEYYGDSIIGFVAIPKNEQRYIEYRVNGRIKRDSITLIEDNISFESKILADFKGKILSNGDIEGKFWCDCLGNGDYATTFLYKETYAPNSLAFDHFYAKVDTVIRADIAEYHNLYDIQLPKKYNPTNAFDTLTNRLLKIIFADGSITHITNNTLNTIIKDAKKDYYESTLKTMADSTMDFMHLIYEEYKSLDIRLNEQGLLSTYYSEYLFTGGAHGLSPCKCNVFDIATGKPIKLEDIITNEETLSQLITRKARSDFKLPETASLNEAGIDVEKIDPTENFYITREGMSFVYNEYEIGPYSSGRLEFMIPFIDLLNYNLIKPNSIIMRVAKF